MLEGCCSAVAGLLYGIHLHCILLTALVLALAPLVLALVHILSALAITIHALIVAVAAAAATTALLLRCRRGRRPFLIATLVFDAISVWLRAMHSRWQHGWR
jgi:hypothetical protein